MSRAKNPRMPIVSCQPRLTRERPKFMTMSHPCPSFLAALTSPAHRTYDSSCASVTAKLERSSGGASEHCSNIVRFALFHKENFDFCGCGCTHTRLPSFTSAWPYIQSYYIETHPNFLVSRLMKSKIWELKCQTWWIGHQYLETNVRVHEPKGMAQSSCGLWVHAHN
jgi:hypothetical protein